jgi:hypothetical protein
VIATNLQEQRPMALETNMMYLTIALLALSGARVLWKRFNRPVQERRRR